MKKILIVYFSKTGENIENCHLKDTGDNGFTKRVAKSLRDKLLSLGKNPVIDEIVSKSGYDRSYASSAERSYLEKTKGIHPSIECNEQLFNECDIVFLGFPNWWGSFPPPVSTYLKIHDFSGKKIIPFLTYGKGIYQFEEDEIKPYIGGATLCDGFHIASAKIEKADNIIDEWFNLNKDFLD